MQYQILGKTGYRISRVIYGGIVSADRYGGVVMPGDGQKDSDDHVAWAVEHGVNYFDVAPSYGDAEERLGRSLIPYRDRVYLACKTTIREGEGAAKEMERSLKLLHTGYFDVYQLHAVSSMEDVERAFAPGGVMEIIRREKERGTIRRVGITAHSEKAAIRAIGLYDFDTVLFPFNWHMNMEYGMGNALLKEARARGMGVLCMKSMIERAWLPGEQEGSKYPKSWCRPFDVSEDAEILLAAVGYALSLGVDAIVPPGNFDHFRFGVEHIDEALAAGCGEEERRILQERLNTVRAYPFFDESAYTL